MEKVTTECGNCHITFPSLELAILHINYNHSTPEACGNCRTKKVLTINIKENCNTCPENHQYVPMINSRGKDPLWGITLRDDDFLFKNGDIFEPPPPLFTPDHLPYNWGNNHNNPMVRLPDITTFTGPSTARFWENPDRNNQNIPAQSNPEYAWDGANMPSTSRSWTEQCARQPPLPTLPLPPTPTHRQPPLPTLPLPPTPTHFRVQCEFCPKFYINPKTLREHVRAVHQNSPQICQYCGIGYKYASNLSRHKKLRHPEEHELYKWKRENYRA